MNRVSRRRRNQVCILIIALGLLNYVAYAVTYAILGGDAHNGHRAVTIQPDGTRSVAFLVRGHHLDTLAGREHAVSAAAWVYSYVHSITVPITWGAVILSMLVLARPHIVATMRGGVVSGEMFVRVFAAVVLLIAGCATLLFVGHFVVEMAR